jgi:AraC-like DNA-binding protein
MDLAMLAAVGRERALLRFGLVPVAIARLAARQLDARALLDELGLDAGSAEPLYLPLAHVRAFLDGCARIAGDPWFGWNLATQQPLGVYGLIEFVLRSAPTLGDGIAALCRYGSLINGLFGFESEQRGDAISVGFSIPGEPHGAGSQLNEYTLHYLLRLVRTFEAVSPATSLEFAHDRGRDAARFERQAGVAARFGAPACRLWLGAEMLARRSPLSDANLHQFLTGQLLAAFAAKRGDDIVRAVHDVLAARLGRSSLDVTHVARALGSTTRTLQRRLHAAGTSYRDVVDLVRYERARELVLVDSLSIAEIAERVGYDDPAVFARAFRRWTGHAPREHRRLW